MSNHTKNLSDVFKFIANHIADEDGTISEDSMPDFEFKYDLHDETTTLAYPYSSSGNAGVVFTTALKNTDDSNYGFVSFDANIIKVGEDSFMKETIVFTNGSSSFLKASGFYQDAGTHGFSAPGSAVFYVESTCSCFATIKRVKVVFNEDRTRNVYFYSNIKGAMLDPVVEDP